MHRPRRKVNLTRYESSVLCVLYAAEPKLMTLVQVYAQIVDGNQAKVGWALGRLRDLHMAERGHDPGTWRITGYGKRHWEAQARAGLQ